MATNKHPGPWTIKMSGDIVDNNGNIVCTVASRDPETRALLLHAAEMLAAVVRLDRIRAAYNDKSLCDELLVVAVGEILDEVKP